MTGTNNSLRVRQQRRPICCECQALDIPCEYRNIEDDCERCKSKGMGCRYFQSSAVNEVEIMLEQDIRSDTANEMRPPPVLKRLRLKLLLTCTQYSALERAMISDSEYDIDRVVENLKSEWFNAGRWLLALAAVDVSLFTIDSQSLFPINVFAQKAVAASSIAAILGLICDVWFLGRYYFLESRAFMTQARDIYGCYAFFALSARLPSFAVLISVLALGVFAGCVAYQTLPAVALVLVSIFGVVMGLQFIVRGSETFYCSIAGALSIVSRWMEKLRQKPLGVVGNNNDLPPAPT
ncbi:hypothetical protein K438DRAFT_1678033 [Mycena galopus ATCC 62051]|nr:hypothetical protein K438DRAFT_1678033 [Mycena galopus ATCC 62051]